MSYQRAPHEEPYPPPGYRPSQQYPYPPPPDVYPPPPQGHGHGHPPQDVYPPPQGPYPPPGYQGYFNDQQRPYYPPPSHQPPPPYGGYQQQHPNGEDSSSGFLKGCKIGSGIDIQIENYIGNKQ
ncbi:hypothetical protein GQ55_6G269500 [Panicum hallii var. hallii]|uniref:Uncharacterized protein n=1 Tax=Panicum hallii var. hallii TaxID=1504633 RepID=A0A2T7DA17_9POAL|nr:hypothetical protein GQ55_6G269500 [Panicum hallii var. hallii]